MARIPGPLFSNIQLSSRFGSREVAFANQGSGYAGPLVSKSSKSPLGF